MCSLVSLSATSLKRLKETGTVSSYLVSLPSNSLQHIFGLLPWSCHLDSEAIRTSSITYLCLDSGLMTSDLEGTFKVSWSNLFILMGNWVRGAKSIVLKKLNKWFFCFPNVISSLFPPHLCISHSYTQFLIAVLEYYSLSSLLWPTMANFWISFRGSTDFWFFIFLTL